MTQSGENEANNPIRFVLHDESSHDNEKCKTHFWKFVFLTVTSFKNYPSVYF